jgi:hypothetical protein
MRQGEPYPVWSDTVLADEAGFTERTAMTLSDKIIAFVALLGLVIFNSVILIWVAEPDLIILVSIALLLAAYDFWRTVFSKSRE